MANYFYYSFLRKLLIAMSWLCAEARENMIKDNKQRNKTSKEQTNLEIAKTENMTLQRLRDNKFETHSLFVHKVKRKFYT